MNEFNKSVNEDKNYIVVLFSNMKTHENKIHAIRVLKKGQS